jgi:AmiR/NasT family two-component response regulator
MALGIVMERFGLTEDQAWDYLRRIANDNETKVVVLAEDIIRAPSEGVRPESAS